jgi:hypothetical protein
MEFNLHKKLATRPTPWILAYINKNHIFHRDSSIGKIKMVMVYFIKFM